MKHVEALPADKEKLEKLEVKLEKSGAFDELKENLPFSTSEDYERLVKKLYHLSLELEEDIREEFEDHLKNYDKHS